jgi:hypothetical protein
MLIGKAADRAVQTMLADALGLKAVEALAGDKVSKDPADLIWRYGTGHVFRRFRIRRCFP